MPYELLSEPIRRYVRDKRWDSLRPIQTAAIKHIMADDRNYILSSRTASGKTEAAFLPILSKVDFKQSGVAVLYIAPLIALINDQFQRVEDLCKYLEVPVTKWHGEASRSLKEGLVKDPRGIVLITPESLEAMFVNRPHYVSALFSKLQYVVIDEIHAFIGSDRGIQLRSILSRLQQVNIAKYSIVGLSATLGDFEQARKMTGDAGRTAILRDKTPKEIVAAFKYFEGGTQELPINLVKDLYRNVHDSKALVFPNSRGRAEEVAVKLRKISEKVKGHPYYFSHHSSVDKAEREHVEQFAKQSKVLNFCIACTSTLELGIDIGVVDRVVQVDATFSIASLIQRVGRSGRREGDKSHLLLYATDRWSLLQSLAVWELYNEEIIERFRISEDAYDVLLHQILSIVKGRSGVPVPELLQQLKENSAFSEIRQEDVWAIIQHALSTGLIEQIQQELIIGVDGEVVVNTRDFYSVFQSEPNLQVVQMGHKIGEIPFSPMVIPGENILLAAKIWKIIDVDQKTNKIEVKPANDGKSPIFLGSGGAVDSMIKQKMWQLLKTDKVFDHIDEAGADALYDLRNEFHPYAVNSIEYDRPVQHEGNSLIFYTFLGTKINRSLSALLGKIGIDHVYNDDNTSFRIVADWPQLDQIRKGLLTALADIDATLATLINDKPQILEFSKWGAYLPLKYQVAILKSRYYDFDGLKYFLDHVSFVRPAIFG